MNAPEMETCYKKPLEKARKNGRIVYLREFISIWRKVNYEEEIDLKKNVRTGTELLRYKGRSKP